MQRRDDDPGADLRKPFAGLLNRHPHASSLNVLFYVGSKDNPARQINLRAIDPERYTIVNEAAGGEVMEEIEESKAFFEVYDGAVYLYQVSFWPCHVNLMWLGVTFHAPLPTLKRMVGLQDSIGNPSLLILPACRLCKASQCCYRATMHRIAGACHAFKHPRVRADAAHCS